MITRRLILKVLGIAATAPVVAKTLPVREELTPVPENRATVDVMSMTFNTGARYGREPHPDPAIGDLFIGTDTRRMYVYTKEGWIPAYGTSS